MSGRGIDFWYRLGRGAARVLIPTFGHIEVVGRENVPPYGPLIIAPNQQSNADPPVLVYAIARPLWWMAKRELFSNPLSAYLMRGVHVHPINRDGRDLEALAWAQETLAADRALVLFPQGTRSPGALSEGGDGLTYIALRSGAPILPVAITGTEKFPLWRILFPLGRMKASIGPPFTLPIIEGRPSREVMSSLLDMVMRRVADQLPPEYRGAYGTNAVRGPAK